MQHAPVSASPAAAPVAAPARAQPRWRVVLGIFKLRIGVLIMLTALAGAAIVPHSALAPWQVLVLALSVLVASASAGAFNQYMEADSDRLMPRTRQRAFASGTLQRGPGWLMLMAALLALSVAVAALALNGLSALFVLLGALTYGLLYTLVLKRRTSWNIVIGGAAGSFAALAGSAAADPQLGPLAWLLALVLLLWTPPHFWSLAIATREQYAAAGVPMLPVVVGPERAARIVFWSTVALVTVAVMPIGLSGTSWAYGVAAVVGGAHFLRKAWALARQPGRERAMAAFFASMVQLSVLIVGIWVDAALR